MCECIVFRHQLFKISEPFIIQQAGHLKLFRPLYLGRERFGSPPRYADSLALEDLPGWNTRSKIWQVASRDPRPYLKLLGNRRVALIHAHFGVEGVYALPLARWLEVPLVTTFHGFDATLSAASLLASRKPSWINYLLRRQQLAAQGDLFLCVSEYIRQRVLDLGFPEERTHVHYIGIDVESIIPRDSQEERRLILHVARLVEKKGTEFLIRAFAKIAHEIPDVGLAVIGEGPLGERLKRLSSELGMRKRVHFVGSLPHNEVMDWMRKAAVLVLPSIHAKSGDSEGLGMVLLEAAASGVPVIGTNHGGIPEAVMDGETGFLVPERDIEGLSRRILELLQNKPLRIRMGMQARGMVERRYNIRQQAAALELFYKRALTASCRHGYLARSDSSAK